MKPATMAWLGCAGCASFLLLGQLFADYAELRGGVTKIVVMILLGLIGLGGYNIILYVAQNEKLQRGQLTQPMMITLAVAGFVMAMLLAVMMVGGF